MNINRKWLFIVLIAFLQLAFVLAFQLFNNQRLNTAATTAINDIAQTGAVPTGSAATQSLFTDILQTQNTNFFALLLVGLVASNLIVGLMSRVKEDFSTVNDTLQQVVVDSSTQLVRTKSAVIVGLARLAESRDNDTGEHLDRIKKYVSLLVRDLSARRGDLDGDYIRNLELASSLHDIGKVGIPDSILLKAGGLTPLERSIMQEHTTIGGDCLDAIHHRLGENDFMEIAKNVAYFHHERWDGAGYPNGIQSTDIPLEARIVAVADVYDALTSKRPYKQAMPHEESREIILKGKGTQFDPEIVEAFLRNEEGFRAISIRQQFINDIDATSEFQRRAQLVAAQMSPTPGDSVAQTVS